MSKKSPNPIDQHAGSRVRMRRMMQSMSQEKLSEALGLTFQQVQKYEKGTNRIGSSRLLQIARTLECPVEFFFQGAPGYKEQAASIDPVAQMMSTASGLALANLFTRIGDSSRRQLLISIAAHFTDVDEVPAVRMAG